MEEGEGEGEEVVEWEWEVTVKVKWEDGEKEEKGIVRKKSIGREGGDVKGRIAEGGGGRVEVRVIWEWG